MKRLHLFALVAISFSLTAATQVAANVLLNPGFETDAFSNQEPLPFATDWFGFGNFATVSEPTAPVRSGVGSLLLTGAGGFGVPGAYQTLPANPGDVWDLQGYMLTNAALPAGATFGLLKIVFSDGIGDLEPESISIGQADAQPFPGVQALPFLNDASPIDTWHFAQARGVAPAGTVQVSFYALFVDENPGEVYFDDLVATLVVDEGIPGDFDGDGDVDGNDFLLWQRGESPSQLSATDLTAWQTNYGAGAGLVATQAVPEPSSVCLALLGVAVIFRRRMILDDAK